MFVTSVRAMHGQFISPNIHSIMVLDYLKKKIKQQDINCLDVYRGYFNCFPDNVENMSGQLRKVK